MKTIFLILLTSFIAHQSVSQTKIYLDDKIEYSSDIDTIDILKYKGKGNYREAQYARELTIIDENTSLLEYCFYYDGKRYVYYNRAYEFYLDDEKVKVSAYGHSETWTYEQISDSLFKIKKTLRNVTEIGYAKRLVPLEKIGAFQVVNTQKDTIYSLTYQNYIFPVLQDISFGICPTNLDLCKKEKAELFHDFVIKSSNATAVRVALDSQVEGLAVIDLSISENGELCNLQFYREGPLPFHNIAILNTFEEKKAKTFISSMKSCRLRLPIRERIYSK